MRRMCESVSYCIFYRYVLLLDYASYVVCTLYIIYIYWIVVHIHIKNEH